VKMKFLKFIQTVTLQGCENYRNFSGSQYTNSNTLQLNQNPTSF
jgi:outer membrane lipoprotein SlyB